MNYIASNKSKLLYGLIANRGETRSSLEVKGYHYWSVRVLLIQNNVPERTHIG